jgi:CelD/BcsL family acetyltransferase involved in cellulose biosynthesis
LHLEVLRDPGRLREFAPEWSAFAEAQPDVTPFQTPEWLLTWWSHFGNGSLHVFVFRKGPECAGVLPCLLHRWRGRRQFTIIGSGISDYLDPLFIASEHAAILETLQQYLTAADDWDICDWQDLADNTPLASLQIGHVQKREEVICRQLDFGAAFDAYWSGRPRHLRRNIRRYTEKARQNGSLDFHVTCHPDERLLLRLIRLHTARWSARGEPGMIAANNSEDFLLDAARLFASRNMLRIYSLNFSGEVAAVILAFVHRQIAYGYLTGFDPAHKQYSLASVLLHDSIQECFGQRLLAWNFCRGDEPYKADWGGQAIRRCRLVLYPNRS